MKKWRSIFSGSQCLIPWNITWHSQWFTIFTWKNKNWKYCKICSQPAWQKKENVRHTIKSKQTIVHGLVLKKIHRVIKFKTIHWYEHRAK